MIGILTRRVTALSVLLSCTACSDNLSSPADQIIDGPFLITTQWKEFTFEPHLSTAPYIQRFQLLSCDESSEITYTSIKNDSFLYTDARFKRLSDQSIIEPEVKLIIDNKPYRFALTSSTYYSRSDLKNCIALGYRFADIGDDNGLFLSEKSKISAAIIKSNTNFIVNKFYWNAPNYWKAPDETWEDVLPSDIIDLSGLSN